VEHRKRSERIASGGTGPSSGRPGSDLLRRRSEIGQRHNLSDRGSLSGRAQHPGGDRRLNGQADGPESAKPVLRSAELDRLNPDSEDSPPRKKKDAEPPGPGQVFDSLNTAVIIIDSSLLIQTLNPAAENLLGISQARAKHRPLLQLIGDDEEMQDILMRVQETSAAYANELRLAPTEVHSEERLVDCRVSVIRRAGHEDALLIEMTDVTRRSKISRENALLIQHGAGRQMIRQLAHEIKNPLGGLRGAAQLLERQLDSNELKEYTDVIISEADRLAGLVDTLLGPGGPPNKQPVNIHELLEYVMRLVEPELSEHIRTRRDYDPGLPNMELDRDQMVQAFLNLVQNAVAALDGHGRITLRSRAVMNFTIGDVRYPVVASVEIEDDGPGIPPDLQDSVFYPLVTSRPEGTGLGLPAAQELISRHGGMIEFESRPGKTVFQVRIPLMTVEAESG